MPMPEAQTIQYLCKAKRKTKRKKRKQQNRHERNEWRYLICNISDQVFAVFKPNYFDLFSRYFEGVIAQGYSCYCLRFFFLPFQYAVVIAVGFLFLFVTDYFFLSSFGILVFGFSYRPFLI